MKHKQRIIAIILSLMMVIVVFPLSAFAEGKAYQIWVGGTRVTDANKNDVLGDGGKVRFNPENQTLTLNNATITGAKAQYNINEESSNFGIEAFTDLKLELVGNNCITAREGFWSAAIFVRKPLTIFGDGSLKAIGGKGSDGSVGIWVDSALTIDSGIVEAQGTEAGGYSSGMLAGRDAEDSITINGGTITATGGTSPGSGGISLASSIKINGGTITAIGGTSINGGNTGIYSYGIIVNGKNRVEINGGTITATGGTSPSSSIGIRNNVYGTIIINGGTLTAT